MPIGKSATASELRCYFLVLHSSAAEMYLATSLIVERKKNLLVVILSLKIASDILFKLWNWVLLGFSNICLFAYRVWLNCRWNISWGLLSDQLLTRPSQEHNTRMSNETDMLLFMDGICLQFHQVHPWSYRAKLCNMQM